MNDRDAFIRAIIARPDDDLPRLIYADWLDENQEPERAEFIRVQCELVRHPLGGDELGKSPPNCWCRTLAPLAGRCPACADCYNSYQQLRAREREFAIKYGQQWAKEILNVAV